MHDGAPVHKTEFIKKGLHDINIEVLEWPSSSPEFNSIENAWNYKKKQLSSSKELQKVLKSCWFIWTKVITKI